MTDPVHGQAGYDVRFEWGPRGAAEIASGVDVAVVVDVLSFSTTVTVAVERGMAVLPFPWDDARAGQHAVETGAVLATGRRAAREQGGASLSPAAMVTAPWVERVLLPSPNGSSICAGLVDTGLTVVAACLRNRAAVASWLSPRLAAGGRVAVVAAGERWPDGTLRPGVEDLWGAGAVLGALEGPTSALSPKARQAAAAFGAVRPGIGAELLACVSGAELVAAGFRDDVQVAGQLDVSDVVPVLVEGAFTAAG